MHRKQSCPWHIATLILTFSQGQEPSWALSHLLLKQPNHVSPQFYSSNCRAGLEPRLPPVPRTQPSPEEAQFPLSSPSQMVPEHVGRGLHTALVAIVVSDLIGSSSHPQSSSPLQLLLFA